MAGRLSGRHLGAILTMALMAFVSCLPPDRANVLNPRIVFTAGSSFLKDAATLALKGQIDFIDKYKTQSGSFQLFFNGRDSLSFNINGPLGVNTFRMVIIGDTAFVLNNGEWIRIKRNEDIEIPEYGINNISPFLIGQLVLPQYYPVVFENGEKAQGTILDIGGTRYIVNWTNLGRVGEQFHILDEETGLFAGYAHRKNYGDGYYPSEILIIELGSDKWQIRFRITKLKKNIRIPESVWKHGG